MQIIRCAKGGFCFLPLLVILHHPHMSSSTCDAHFSRSPFFHNLIGDQRVNVTLVPTDVACSLRPSRGISTPKVVVGLCTYHSDAEIIDEVSNALRFTAPSTTGVVVHIDGHIGFSDVLARGLRHLSYISNGGMMVNSFRVHTQRITGTILLAHLTNYMAAKASGWAPRYYVMMAANSRFFRCGIEGRLGLAFGHREVCDGHKSHVNGKGSHADTRAFSLAYPQTWALAPIDHAASISGLLGVLFGVGPPSTSNSSAHAHWIREFIVVNFHIVIQRHEGAVFPAEPLDTLTDFLTNRTALGTLADAKLPAEEFLVSTWIVNKHPRLVPRDTRSRDVAAYLVAGRAGLASELELKNAFEDSNADGGYFLIKRANSQSLPSLVRASQAIDAQVCSAKNNELHEPNSSSHIEKILSPCIGRSFTDKSRTLTTMTQMRIAPPSPHMPSSLEKLASSSIGPFCMVTTSGNKRPSRQIPSRASRATSHVARANGGHLQS